MHNSALFAHIFTYFYIFFTYFLTYFLIYMHINAYKCTFETYCCICFLHILSLHMFAY